MFVMQVNQYQLGVFVFAEASVRMNEQAIFLFMTPFRKRLRLAISISSKGFYEGSWET